MDSKINGRMNPTISSSTDTRVTDLIDAGYSSSSGSNSSSNTKLSNQNHPQSLHCISSSVRNFGNAGALGVDGAVFEDCNNIGLVDGSLAAKQFCDPGTNDYLKCDTALWEDFVNIQRGTHLNMNANVATSESLPSANPRLTSTTGACKFIKDEKEPSVIIDTPCPNFDTSSSSDIQLLGNGDLTRFTPSVASSRQGLSGSPHFLIDLNQSPEQLSALNQVRTDSRCGIVVPVKAVSNFDSNMHTAAAQQQQQQMTLYKTEVSRWQMQTSPAEGQYWCQSDDPVTHSGCDGSQTQALMSMRNPTQYSIFQGIPPHRMCVICSDEASGCHYGVLTCGSCKVFFKRAVEGHHSYLCAGRNDCIVDKLRRKNCPACRLRKCYQAGMMLGGRKLKRFGALKAFGMAPSLMFQSHLAMSGGDNGQALSSIPAMHLSQQILNILESIEPEMVYSGYDNTQLDGPHVLLNSLNRLCEKQLLWIVKWSKSLPGFRNLHINDQMTLIQYSWMNLMVFSLGWRSFQNVTSEYLYFAPDLVLNQEQMRRTPIYDICLAIQFIPQEFFNLQVTREEFLCMKAIILLNTVPLEGLKAQAAFEEMRQSYIRELTQAIHMREKGLVASSQRFYHLTKLMDSMHDIVKKVNLFCLTTYIQADSMRVEFPEMMSEVISSQLPKILAGMVRPLLFHTK